MTTGREARPAAADGMLTPEDVAEAVVKGMDAEQFLIFPHEIVHEYMRRKLDDRDRWLRGMARVRKRLFAATGS